MEIKNLEEFRKLIKEKRKESNLTQRDLAFAINSSVRLIVEFERGERNIKSDTLLKLCNALNLKVNIG